MPDVSTNVIALNEYHDIEPRQHAPGEWNATDGVGETALAMAVARWRESDAPRPLFADPFALLFVTAACDSGWRPALLTRSSEDLRAIDPVLSERIQALHDYAACRTRFFDDFFERAISDGVRQAVILGAGLDARAWRLHWAPGSVFFDIDRPKVLDFKVSAMWAANAEPACEYRTVATDLRSDWPAALRDAGFDPRLPTAWSVEGSLAYIPGAGQDRLFELIDGLSAPGSLLAAESASPSDPHASRRLRRIRETREAAAAVGDTFLRDVRSLWFDRRRSYLGNWLETRGWQTTTSEAEDLMACYGRAPGLDALGVAPLSAFVQGSR